MKELLKIGTIIEIEQTDSTSNKKIILNMKVIETHNNHYLCRCVEDKGLYAKVSLVNNEYIIIDAVNVRSTSVSEIDEIAFCEKDRSDVYNISILRNGRYMAVDQSYIEELFKQK